MDVSIKLARFANIFNFFHRDKSLFYFIFNLI